MGGGKVQDISANLPAPLVPADCDLRGYKMMLDGARLFGSSFDGIANDSEWRAGVTLWVKSFEQMPAASLPDSDAKLAILAQVDLRKWRRIKGVALRGWIQCSDGRLYHPVVAGVALEGWLSRLKTRKASAVGVAKKNNLVTNLSQILAAIETALEHVLRLNGYNNVSETENIPAQTVEKELTTGSTGEEPSVQLTLDHPVNQGKGKGSSSVEPKGSTAAVAAEFTLQSEDAVAAPKPSSAEKPPPSKPPATDPKAILYREGRDVLGRDAGSVITQLLQICEGKVRKASYLLQEAREKQDPRSWLMAVLLKNAKPGQDVYGMQGSM